MDAKALVSIILPTYNHEKYVVQALDSIYSQMLDKIELIIIDDCSKDDTFKIAGQWAQAKKNRFCRLEIRRNEKNIGAHATINAGLQWAEGKYLSILNSDDWYDSKRLLRMLQCLDSAKGQYAFSNILVVNEKGELLNNEQLSKDCMTLEDQLDAYPTIGFALLDRNIAVTTGNIVFTRELQQKVGEFNNLKLVHDWDFLLRCLAYEEPVYIPESLYYYRVYTGNSFKKLKTESYMESQVIMRKYFKIINNNQYENKYFPLYKLFNNYERLSMMQKYIGRQIIDCSSLASGYESYRINKNF